MSHENEKSENEIIYLLFSQCPTARAMNATKKYVTIKMASLSTLLPFSYFGLSSTFTLRVTTSPTFRSSFFYFLSIVVSVSLVL